MTALSDADFASVVARANLAPSVHNTQPTRWRQDQDAIILSLDKSRLLSVGDPQARDAWLSCGAALEGTRLALSETGRTIHATERDADQVRLVLGEHDTPDPKAQLATQRSTWRGGYVEAENPTKGALRSLCEQREDATLVADPSGIEALAALNDEVSLHFFRTKPYRDELLSWMRLSRRHAMWAQDGLNADALGMNRLEAFGAGIVLRSPVFELLDKMTLSSGLTSERAKTLTATGIVLFHRPAEESPLDSGIAFYRLWLGLTAIGLSAWPMAAIADDPDARANTSRQFNVPPAHCLINLLRVGVSPDKRPPARARLDTKALLSQ